MSTLQVKSSDLLNEYVTLSKDNSVENITRGKLRMQHYYTFLTSEANNYAVEKTKYGVTKAGQRSYLMMPDYYKMKTVRVKVGSIWHPLTEIVSLDRWHEMTMLQSSSAQAYTYIIINENGNVHIELDPIPSADGDPEDPNLELIYEGYLDPLYFPPDYTTGTVTAYGGDQTVTGVNTAWTSALVGRFLNIGKWYYEIASVDSTTQLQLVNYYQESTATAQSYRIAELMRLPPEFSYTPLWGALKDYWRNGDKAKHDSYAQDYARELLMLQNKYQSKSKGSVTPGRPVNGYRRLYTPSNYPNQLIGQ